VLAIIFMILAVQVAIIKIVKTTLKPFLQIQLETELKRCLTPLAPNLVMIIYPFIMAPTPAPLSFSEVAEVPVQAPLDLVILQVR
jgi:hypothetical protein